VRMTYGSSGVTTAGMMNARLVLHAHLLSVSMSSTTRGRPCEMRPRAGEDFCGWHGAERSDR